MAEDPSLTELLHSLMPFTADLGLRGVSSSPERVVGEADWAPERCTSGGLLHGGYLMAIADSAGAVCAGLNLPPGATTATLQSTTNLLRGVREGTVTVTSTPVHVGRSTIVVQTDVTDDSGRLVARTTQTQAILGGG